MKTVLCYGDSNTYGYIPETGMRYPRDVRYPGRLQLLLGDEYAVVEEGCNGRTTIHDDPIDGWKNGRDYLKPCLNSHKPVDIVILMLGSNDLKATFHLTAEQIAEGAGELVDVIQNFAIEKQGFVPKIILVSPPEIGTGIRTSPFYGAFYEEAIAESKRFPECYKMVADAKGCIFFNAAEHIYPSEVDSLHLTPEGHKVLAEKLREIVKGISGYKNTEGADMTNQKIPEEAVRKLDSLFESYSLIAEDTHVFLCDMRYDYSRWSKELVETFGLPSEYMYNAGFIWEQHIHPEDRQAYHEGVDAIFAGKQAGHDMQYRALRPDGETVLCTCRGIVITDEFGTPEYFGGAIRNHNQRSHIDTLTGLRNQYGFFADLQEYIRNKKEVRIGMAGIGKLTEINEVYGYKVGNKILQYFGRYLMDNVTNRGGTYRMDGACFAIMSTVQTTEQLADLYEEIRAQFRKGIKVDDLELSVELNAGLLSLEDFDVDDQTVYSFLNFAYEESKIKKHGDLVIFRSGQKGDSRRELEKLHAIRAAISKDYNGFYLVYQPVVDAETEKLIGAEALLRFKNEKYGVVPPDVFIPFLETDPLFPELGEWILKTALHDAKKLIEYVPGFVINVNLSYSQMERADFTEVVWNAIRKAGFSPEHLCLEITERCRLLDMDLLRNVMVSLRAEGVRIALDDFGTGYSAVGLIKNLPFDTIKIDRSFVREIEEDEKERRMVNNFTDLAGTFGADVCVEGIETPGMREILKDYGIHSLQGYYYSRPVPIGELLDMAKRWTDCLAK